MLIDLIRSLVNLEASYKTAIRKILQKRGEQLRLKVTYNQNDFKSLDKKTEYFLKLCKFYFHKSQKLSRPMLWPCSLTTDMESQMDYVLQLIETLPDCKVILFHDWQFEEPAAIPCLEGS